MESPTREELADEKRKLRRQTRREVLRKSAAILVALHCSAVVKEHLASALLLVVAALSLYGATWYIMGWLYEAVQPATFGWNAILAAELVAFLWRDASGAVFEFFMPGVEGHADGHHGEAGNHEEPALAEAPHTVESTSLVFRASKIKQIHQLASGVAFPSTPPAASEEHHVAAGKTVGEAELESAVALIAWVVILLAAGVAWIAVAKRVRQRALLEHEEAGDKEQVEKSEHVGEVMLDIEVDMFGLAVAWAARSAFNHILLGEEWHEIVEEGTDKRLSAGYAHGLLIVFLLLGVLHATELCGVRDEGSLFLIATTSCGFWTGTQLDTYWRHVFHGGLHHGLSPIFIAYPFLMLFLGSSIVASFRLQQEHGPADSCCYRRCSSCCECYRSCMECWAGNKVRTRLLDILILAYQMCMALAFEGLFEAIHHKYSGAASGTSGLVLAISLLVAWTLTVYVFPHEGITVSDADESEGLSGKTNATS